MSIIGEMHEEEMAKMELKHHEEIAELTRKLQVAESQTKNTAVVGLHEGKEARRALFVMSGDPIHHGHLDVIERASALYDAVTVGIAVNPEKRYLFNLNERLAMARDEIARLRPRRDPSGHLANVSVAEVQGLTVDYAYEHGIDVIVKGVRDAKDYEYETLLHEIGESQQLGIETIILPARREHHHLSSSAVKELQKFHGLVNEFVPLGVKQQLEARISGQYLLGVTGDVGCGKSTISQEIVKLATAQGIPAYHIDLDKIGHAVYERPEPGYQRVRDEIGRAFSGTRRDDGSIDRKALGERVFGDKQALARLDEIVQTSLLVGLRRELEGKKGLILLEAALLSEFGLSYLTNNNVLVVTADQDVQYSRLVSRGLAREQIVRRLASQYRTPEKMAALQQQIAHDRYGHLWMYDTTNGSDAATLGQPFEEIITALGVKEVGA